MYEIVLDEFIVIFDLSRDFGFGKRSMDELVKDEFKKFTQHIDKLLATGKPKKYIE